MIGKQKVFTSKCQCLEAVVVITIIIIVWLVMLSPVVIYFLVSVYNNIVLIQFENVSMLVGFWV